MIDVAINTKKKPVKRKNVLIQFRHISKANFYWYVYIQVLCENKRKTQMIIYTVYNTVEFESLALQMRNFLILLGAMC